MSTLNLKKKLQEQEMIIKGLEEGAELWKSEYDSCRCILAALIDTINDKEARAQTIFQAKAFLKTYQHLPQHIDAPNSYNLPNDTPMNSIPPN